MNLLTEIFGRWKLATPVSIRGSGDFKLSVVSQRQYHGNLAQICGGTAVSGVENVTTAVLHLENENQYDSQAVRISIKGLTVGFLSRIGARSLRAQLTRLGHHALTATCVARIAGGFSCGNINEDYFGVRLDVPSM
jgi:hypothetical protein